jgi:hypothetical protein
VLRFRPAGLIPERLPRLPIGKPRSGPGRDDEDPGLGAASAAAVPSAQPPGAGRGPGR